MNSDPRDEKLRELKSELGGWIGELIWELDNGARVILVDQSAVGESFTAPALRSIGALVKICGSYGATVIFSNKNETAIHDSFDRG